MPGWTGSAQEDCGDGARTLHGIGAWEYETFLRDCVVKEMQRRKVKETQRRCALRRRENRNERMER